MTDRAITGKRGRQTGDGFKPCVQILEGELELRILRRMLSSTTASAQKEPMNASHNPTVAAIDLGHGHVKAATRINRDARIETSFPSFVGTSSALSQGASSLQELDVVPVTVKGRQFIVGKDSERVRQPGSDRNRDPGYCATDEYKALMLGALWTLQRHEIDVLVVGLPLTTLAKHRQKLEQIFTGEHEVPAFDAPFGGRTVKIKVKRVMVLGQPFGAFMNSLVRHEHLASEKVLLLDLGYNTLDQLVVSNGQPVPTLTDAYNGGVAGFFDEIAAALEQEAAETYPDITERLKVAHHVIETAVLNNAAVRTSLGRFDVAKLMEKAQPKLDQYMQTVAAKLGEERSSITAAVLAGGGAPLMEAAFRRQFPIIREIHVDKDPQFSIVRGYLSFGDRKAREANA